VSAFLSARTEKDSRAEARPGHRFLRPILALSSLVGAAGKGLRLIEQLDLKKKPSEYIRSGNVYFNCEGGEVTLPYALKRIGHQAVLFASDFPHETNIERARHEIETQAGRAQV
jgi:hypothetical protein